MTRVPKWAVRISRDTVVIAVGMVGLAHETFFVEKPDDILVWLFGGFVLGVPILHQGDKKKDQQERQAQQEKT